jgi:hypothetical protein
VTKKKEKKEKEKNRKTKAMTKDLWTVLVDITKDFFS